MSGKLAKRKENNNGSNNMFNSGGYIRRAHHAGSWYHDDKQMLDAALSRYLQSAAGDKDSKNQTQSDCALRGIICPHAGYDYSGPTAAYGYHELSRELIKKNCPIRHILVFHPSHHVYLDGIAICGGNKLETPVGDLPVDTILREEILNLKPGFFDIMTRDVDEMEHSGEMQFPFIAKIQNDAIKKRGGAMIPVLPIMCGSISKSKESEYGKYLAEVVARKDVFSIVSTGT